MENAFQLGLQDFMQVGGLFLANICYGLERWAVGGYLKVFPLINHTKFFF